MWICDLCVHFRLHSGRRPHVCDVCGSTFKQNRELCIHYKVHTGKRLYVCEICGISFMQKSDLIINYRKHTGQRLYICQVCSKLSLVQPIDWFISECIPYIDHILVTLVESLLISLMYWSNTFTYTQVKNHVHVGYVFSRLYPAVVLENTVDVSNTLSLQFLYVQFRIQSVTFTLIIISTIIG